MKKYLFLILTLAAIISSCQDDVVEKIKIPGKNLCTRITINGICSDSLSRSGSVLNFEGGTASGAGLYDENEKPIVSVTPNDGYEVDYFFGGTGRNEHLYDYARNKETSFTVDMAKGDYNFHVKFKKKASKCHIRFNIIGNGTINQTEGDFYPDRWYDLKATPKAGYTFVGWERSSNIYISDKELGPKSRFKASDANDGEITVRFAKIPNNILLCGSNGNNTYGIIYYNGEVHEFKNVSSIKHIARYGKKIIALGTSSSGLYSIVSPNGGMSWYAPKLIPNTAGFSIRAFEYGNGMFLGVGPNKKLIQTVDGFNWTTRDISSNLGSAAIAYGNSAWTSISFGSRPGYNTIQRNTGNPMTDNWVSVNEPLRDDLGHDWQMSLTDIVFGKGKVVISTNVRALLISKNLYSSTYEKRIGVKNLIRNIKDLKFQNNKFIAVGGNNPRGDTDESCYITTSDDAINWSVPQLVYKTVLVTDHSQPKIFESYGNSMIILSTDSKIITSSDGGNNWSERYNLYSTDSSLLFGTIYDVLVSE